MSHDKSDEQIKYQCSDCDYSTVVKSNLLRHIKAKHANNNENQRVISRDAIEIITNNRQNDKSVIDNPIVERNEDDEPEIDIEDYVTQKVADLLKANDLPPVKVSKTLMRSCFTGTVPSFLAGSFVGFILSNYIPMLAMLFKKKTLLVQPPAPPPLPETLASVAESDTIRSVPLTEPSL